MKISYVSDTHADFYIPFTPNQIKFQQRTEEFTRKLIETDTGSKEVLVLAGDISHFNLQSYWIIKEFSNYYEQVFIQYGNHDMYLISNNQASKYKNHSMNRIIELEQMLSTVPNVHTLFNGETYEFQDVKFGGCTMFYPLETTEQQMFFHSYSNDSKLIKGFNIQEAYHEDQKKYGLLMHQEIDVMVSHVPLIHIKSHQKYNSTSCYYTPVNQLPRYVVMGHSHEQDVYEKAGSKLYMNCLGYPDQIELELTIKHFTISK